MSTGGRALAARLRMALKDAGIPLWLKSPMTELVLDGNGTVTGIVVERDGTSMRIGARRGVLLATGGFDHNQEMRDGYLPEGGRADISAAVVQDRPEEAARSAVRGVRPRVPLWIGDWLVIKK